MLNRNVLYLVISVLAVAAVVFGYQLYQERQKTTGIEINVGKGGILDREKIVLQLSTIVTGRALLGNTAVRSPI